MLPGIIGSLQALETIKLITGVGDPLIGRLLLFDGAALKFRELRLRRNHGVSRVWGRADRHRAHRLRGVLRNEG